MRRESDKLRLPQRRAGLFPHPAVIGLTGCAGAGKSSAASVFRSLGARVVDADRIGHRLLRRSSPCYSKIVKTFGPGILDRRGEVVRSKLGDLVFADARQRRRLNRIVHPELVHKVKSEIDKLKSKWGGPVVVDAALLVDWGLHRRTDKLVVVKAPAGIRLKRLTAKGMDPRKAKGLMAAQMPSGKLTKLADVVIDNSGTRQQLRRRAAAAWAHLGLKVEKRPGM